ncbi:hypothetical protein LINGRAHAP2_LOCUS36731 [Linum grandiflorum]
MSRNQSLRRHHAFGNIGHRRAASNPRKNGGFRSDIFRQVRRFALVLGRGLHHRAKH